MNNKTMNNNSDQNKNSKEINITELQKIIPINNNDNKKHNKVMDMIRLAS